MMYVSQHENMLKNDAQTRNSSTSVMKVSSMLVNMIKLSTERLFSCVFTTERLFILD